MSTRPATPCLLLPILLCISLNGSGQQLELATYRFVDDIVNRQSALYDSARAALNRGDITEDSAAVLFEQSLSVSESIEQQIEQLSGKSRPLDRLLTASLHDRGVLFYRLNQFDRASTNILLAATLMESCYSVVHPELVQEYYNLGNAYLQDQQPENAIPAFERSIALHSLDIEPNNKRLAEAFLQLAYSYLAIQDVEPARVAFLRAVERYQKSAAEDPAWMYQVYEGLTKFHIDTKQPQLAVEAGEMALEKAYEAAQLYPVLNSHLNLGAAYYLASELDSAARQDETGIEVHQAYLTPDLQYSQYYSNLATVNWKRGRYAAAVQGVDEAITTIRNLREQGAISEAQANRQLSHYFHNKAIYLDHQGAFEQANQLHTEALKIAFPNWQPDGLGDLPVLDDPQLISLPRLAEYLRWKAAGLARQSAATGDSKYLEAAIDIHQANSKLLERIHLDVATLESKHFIAEQSKDILAEAIATTFQLYQADQSEARLGQLFNFMERSKALSLLEALQAAETTKLDSLAPELLNRQRILQRKVTELREQSNSDPAAANQLLEVRRQLVGVRQEMMAALGNNPEEDRSLRIADLGQLRKALQEDQLIVEYFVGNDYVYALHASQTEQGVQRTALTELPLDSLIGEWHETMEASLVNDRRSERATLFQQNAQISHLLFDRLLRPALAGSQAGHHLLIIPDESLGRIPFAALHTEAVGDSVPYTRYPYLIRSHPVSYAYSASVLQQRMQPGEAAGPGKVLAFAPDFSENTTLHVGGDTVILRPLPGNVETAEKVVGQFSGEVVSGDRATTERFWKAADQFDILLFITHGFVSPFSGDQSFIAFSGDRLHLEEIYTKPIPAELVVLSACQTGVGKLQRGEGIISLARAFSYAGSASVVSTLWSVQNNTTQQLITDYFDRLGNQVEKFDALHQAQLALLNDPQTAHPYLWSGFVSYGDWQPLSSTVTTSATLSGDRPWGLLLVVVGAVAAAVVVLLRRMKYEK